MRVYLDTGVFIDYLSGRGVIGTNLRSEGRRGRTLQQVLLDAERLCDRVARQHRGATSALTCYEAEEALYKSLDAATTGVARAERFRVAAARSIVFQLRIAVETFQVQVLELTGETIDTSYAPWSWSLAGSERPMRPMSRLRRHGMPTCS